MTALEDVLPAIDSWGAEHAAAAVLGPAGVLGARGDQDRTFRWASPAKIGTALVVLRQVGPLFGLRRIQLLAGQQGQQGLIEPVHAGQE